MSRDSLELELKNGSLHCLLLENQKHGAVQYIKLVQNIGIRS